MIASTGMPVRTDRIHRYVTAFCPRCHEEEPGRPLADVDRLAGYLAEDDGRIWLVRGCPTHGKIVTLYDENPEILRYLEQWTAPTKAHRPDTQNNYDPVPSAYLRGLGELQTQHTCILLEDIIAQCNLSCPTCFAESSPDMAGVVPMETIVANVEQRLARENGRLDVLMLSVGEPTLHPHIVELLDELAGRNIVRILLNTNGIQVAKNDRLLACLERHNTRVETYLQFDGFRLDTHKHHRGADLRRIKQDAVARLGAAGVFTTLTMTTALGVNDDEIGDVVRYAFETPFVGGVSIQPVFGSGRSSRIDAVERLTHTGVLARLGPQTKGLVTWQGMTALPCSHPHCCSVGYFMSTDAGEWKSLLAAIGPEEVKAHLGLVSNRIAAEGVSAEIRELVKQSLLGLMSEQTSLTHPSVLNMFKNICDACDLGLGSFMRLAGDALTGKQATYRKLWSERIKRITIKPFMDMNTMIEERLQQCCVHVGTQSDAQHQCVPFCAAQAWRPLSRMKLAERAQRTPMAATGGAAFHA
jgi:7,8-dihydro-6-hydroxymethylpterin dimethyltransferase